MTTYRVTWEIDIEADTPAEAALIAQSYQRDPNALSNVFTVGERGEIPAEIDLDTVQPLYICHAPMVPSVQPEKIHATYSFDARKAFAAKHTGMVPSDVCAVRLAR